MSAEQEAAPPHRAPCVWFFLPLPEPLGIPDQYQFAELESFEDSETGMPGTGLRSSLRILQLDRSVNVLMSDIFDVMRASSVASGRGDPGKALPDLPEDLTQEMRTILTVAEVAVPLLSASDDLNDALDAAIDHINFVQQCYAAVTQRAVTLLTRSHLAPIVHVLSGTVGENEPPTYDEAIQFVIEDAALPSRFGLEPSWLTEDQLSNFAAALDQFSRGAAFAPYVDLRREALTQVGGGSARAGVVMLATAGEVFLDTLILHLRWEEAEDPSQTAQVFQAIEKHSRKVATNLPHRLGGNWDPNSVGPVGAYFRDLVYLRHRVVHVGHRPAREEVSQATEALVNLEHFVGDRLCAPGILNRYPRTAMAFLGERGIRKRAAWSRSIASLTADDTEPNWIASFARWRHFLDRETDPSAPPPGMTDSLAVYVELASDGSARWIAHDASTCCASEFDPNGRFPDAEVAGVETAVRLLSDPPRRLRVAAPRALDGLTWVRDVDVFSELTLKPTYD